MVLQTVAKEKIMTTGEKIYTLRKNAQITQEEFAEQLEVSRQAVSKWESDQSYPETDKIIKIAQMFGVTCDYLLNDGPRYESTHVDKKNHNFLSLMVSFSIVCVAVGLIVAIICLYTISKWYCSLIGLGVLAGLLIVAFILWSVSRYKFLSNCDYSEDDKSHLAKWTKVFTYTAIVGIFCYLPSVVFIGLSAKWYLKLPFGLFALSQLTFVPVGLSVAIIISAIQDRILGKTVSVAQFCDKICLTLILSVCVFAYVNITYAYFKYLYFILDDFDFRARKALVFLITACVFTLILIVQSCIYKKHERTNNAVFILQICCTILLFLYFLHYFVYVKTYNDYLPLFYTDIAFGGILVAVATVMVIMSVIAAKQKNGASLNLLRYSIPCFLFATIQLSEYLDEFGVVVWLALHCFIAAIIGTLKFRRKSENTENKLQ